MFRSTLKKIILGANDALFNFIENIFHGYITFHLRPKSSAEINTRADGLKTYPKVAIIIQGPLLGKDEFTLNTIRLYKKIFGNYRIILSIWEDEDDKTLNKIKKEGVEIIFNKKPETTGIQHINYQIVSTSNAIKKAKEFGSEYVLKTRTDLRIYNPNSIEFLVNMLKTFPLNNGGKQNKRIIFPSLNSFKYRPYSVTDLIMFGDINDLEDYWGTKLDTRKTPPANDLIGDWSHARLGEVYLSANYLESLGHKLLWTVADSWQAYADHFCIFDAQSLDLYWHKYARDREFRNLGYKLMKNNRELTFSEWLNMFAGLSNKEIVPEHILNNRFKETINGDL